MTTLLTGIWTGFLQPILQRPKRIQMAALCHRDGAEGQQVLLITSRDSGRWILPKGWPIAGKTASETALQEAWEEAGVKQGMAQPAAIGSYVYNKGLARGWSIPVKTYVYPVAVNRLCDTFPEVDERNRKWVTPSEAANLVDEPGLKSILSNFPA